MMYKMINRYILIQILFYFFLNFDLVEKKMIQIKKEYFVWIVYINAALYATCFQL